MNLYSTKNRSLQVSLEQAVLQGMPADGGLFFPLQIPRLPDDLFQDAKKMEFPQLALRVARILLGDDIPGAALEEMTTGAFDFPVPLIPLDGRTAVLELFHGPTLAFKDFGARFLARLMAFFNHRKGRELTVMVATSGDTGSAVAQGFYRVPGMKVVVLYPEGRISPVQEQQIATLGENITALEVAGSFDDCQKLVKQSLADGELQRKRPLTTANSINIGRLIPQIFYSIHAWGRLEASRGQKTVAAVPSGNFGNLTAGVMARRLGLPIDRFIAATNSNDTVPRYLRDGQYRPLPVRVSIANAMDVADPSNFVRLLELCGSDFHGMAGEIRGYASPDEAIRRAIHDVFLQKGYILDPHGAAGYIALWKFLEGEGDDWRGFFLATAHPAKFAEIVEPEIGRAVPIPERLQAWLNRPKHAVALPPAYPALKEFLLSSR